MEMLRATLPPTTIATNMVPQADLQLHGRRKEWRLDLAALEPDVEEIHKRMLHLRIRMCVLAGTLLEFVGALFSVLPGTLALVLRHAPVRRKVYRYLWMVVCLALIIGSVVYLPWFAALVIASPFAALFLIVLFAGWFATADEFDERLAEIIKALTEKKDALLRHRNIVNSAIEAFIDAPAEHTEHSETEPYIAGSASDVDANNAALDRKLELYVGNESATSYIERIRSVTTQLAIRRSKSEFAYEQEKVRLERRKTAKLWSSTVMALTLSSGLTSLKITFVIFTVLFLPVLLTLFETNSGQASAVPESAPIEAGAVAEDSMLDIMVDGKEEVGFSDVKRFGVMILVGLILSHFVGLLLRILFRIVPRHRQMAKAQKQAEIDGLLNELNWQASELLLFENLLTAMEQTAAILQTELTVAERDLVKRDQEQANGKIASSKLRLARLTKKPWSNKAKGADARGGVMDSGAPEDISGDVADLLL